jgi:hypothetical protein
MIRQLATGISISMLLAACVTHVPAERFANSMQNQVGRGIDDPSALRNRNPDLRGSTRTLSNGNTEEQLIFGRGCAALFEIDKKTRTIIKWRVDPKRDENCETPPG